MRRSLKWVQSTTGEGVGLLGTGRYLPPRQVTAEEIDQRMTVKPGWTINRSGIRIRHFVDDDTNATMGAKAALRALDSAGVSLSEIDAIICGSGSIQQPIPCTAALIQRELGSEALGCATFDLNSTCLSFVSGLDVAASLIATGRYRLILLISSETASVAINWAHPESASLLADGAAAAVIGRRDGSAVHGSCFATDSEGANFAQIVGGGTSMPPVHCTGSDDPNFLFAMDGKGVFKSALKWVPRLFHELDRQGGVGMDKIDLVIPHQASLSSLRILQRKLQIPPEKFYVQIETTGNTVAASIPLALGSAIEEGRLKRGQRVLLAGTSAGFSIGALYFTY